MEHLFEDAIHTRINIFEKCVEENVLVKHSSSLADVSINL